MDNERFDQPMYYDDVAEIIPYEDYDHLRVCSTHFFFFIISLHLSIKVIQLVCIEEKIDNYFPSFLPCLIFWVFLYLVKFLGKKVCLILYYFFFHCTHHSFPLLTGVHPLYVCAYIAIFLPPSHHHLYLHNQMGMMMMAI